MKIVIDIPAEDFEAYKMQVKTIEQEGIYYESSNYKLKRLIANGTPLPEGAEILTKEAYSDLCTRAADVPDFESKEYVEERIKNYDKMLKSGILDCVIKKPQESEDGE